MTNASPPMVLTVHCQLKVHVADPSQLTELAVRELRESEIDWSHEEDDVETASAELRTDVAISLSALVDPHRLVVGIPGISAQGGRVWAEAAEG